MNEFKNLKWSDIKSHTMNSDEYFKKYELKPSILKNYENYNPKPRVIKEIKDLLLKNQIKLKILAIGANWCPDCIINIPNLIKITHKFTNEVIQLQILYGVKVKAFRKKEEIKWHKKKSPPEAVDPKFDLNAIPTFYFFNEKGNYLGRIVERPKLTIEEDLIHILKNQA